MPGPAEHLPFGGSSAHRWMLCPGSHRLVASLPPQPENEHMARGTRAHALLEAALSERMDSVLDFAGLTLSGFTRHLEQEDVEAVQIAVDYVNGLLERHPDAELYVEKRVTLDPEIGGTADVLIYVPSMRHLHVIDYKHGGGWYVDEWAPQFRFYATCAVISMPELNVTTIYATVIQPRHWQCKDNPVKTAPYGPADLLTYSDDVEAAVAAARAPDATLVPGEAQCHWCPAAAVCPALATAATSWVTLPVEAYNRPPRGDEIRIVLPPAHECRDPAVLGQTLAATKLLSAWIEAIEEAAYGEAMAGRQIPGFKLVPKRATRKWTDEDAVAAAVKPHTLGRQIYDFKLKSPAQMEKLLKGNKPAIQEIAQFVNKESSGLKLVPETEPGDPVNPLALLTASVPPPEDL